MDGTFPDVASFCEQCQKLESSGFFNSLHDKNIAEDGEPVSSLGRFPQDITAIKCNLCRFFSQFEVRYKRKHIQHVRLFRRLKRGNAPIPDIREAPLFFSIIRENSRLQHDWRIKNEIVDNGVCMYLPAPNKSNSSSEIPRRIETTTIDYSILATFIADCKTHPQCNQIPPSPQRLAYIRLIDCTSERRIVCEPNNNPYCCLSCVWGSSRRNDGSLPSNGSVDGALANVPLTIRDAMSVALKLGYRYLWVDRYCISQNDAEEKELMLRSMDQIYEHADLTLVNLHGDNDEAGLPGVSSTIRKEQPSFKIGNGTLIFSWPAISKVIGASAWATRGWTYQEARLSRRCLFFSEEQAYFVCRASTRSETVPNPPGQVWIADALNDESLTSFHVLFGSSASLGDSLLDDRLMFTQRKLSYEYDVLDAFRGILARSLQHTLWGVPIYVKQGQLDAAQGLALGMAWSKRPSRLEDKHLLATPKRPSLRRNDFPTWSWASVTGEIYFIGGQELNKILEGTRGSNANEANIQISIKLNDDLVSLDPWLQMAQSLILPETLGTGELLVSGDITQVQLSVHEVGEVSAWIDSRGGTYGPGRWPVLHDLDSDREQLLTEASSAKRLTKWSKKQDALIIVRGQAPRSPLSTRARVVLMLLQWVDTDRAERKGIVSSYDIGMHQEFANGISVTRRTFVLQ